MSAQDVMEVSYAYANSIVVCVLSASGNSFYIDYMFQEKEWCYSKTELNVYAHHFFSIQSVSAKHKHKRIVQKPIMFKL